MLTINAHQILGLPGDILKNMRCTEGYLLWASSQRVIYLLHEQGSYGFFRRCFSDLTTVVVNLTNHRGAIDNQESRAAHIPLRCGDCMTVLEGSCFGEDPSLRIERAWSRAASS